MDEVLNANQANEVSFKRDIRPDDQDRLIFSLFRDLQLLKLQR